MSPPIGRREFLGTAAAVTASLAALPGLGVSNASAFARQPAGDVPATPRYPKALKIGMIAGGATLAEKFAIARDAGFDGVELDAPSGLDTAEVLDAKQATGMIVPGVVNSVHWSKPLSHPDESVREAGIAGLEQAIRDCDAWVGPASSWKGPGPRTALLVPAVVNGAMSYADARRLSITGITRVLPLAKELGVTIAIENVWNGFLLSPLEAAAYVDEINAIAGARVCGWYFDIGNIWNYGWPAHWIEALGDRIARLDLKGYSRAKADKEGKWGGFGVEIDEGDLDWRAVRQSLRAIGYAGWATAEVGGGGPDPLRDIAARMDKVLNHDD